jgi:hypothetical protein
MKLDCQGAVFGPDQLKAMHRAYDEAFHALEADLSPDPVAVHCVKMKLALAIIALAKLQGTRDHEGLAQSALEVFGGARLEVQPRARAITLSRSAAPS